jgi:predicted metal-binding membrane protein
MNQPAFRRLTHDQFLVLVCLAAISLLAWTYLIRLGHSIPGMAMNGAGPSADEMAGMEMDGMATASLAWQLPNFALVAVMWAVMMAGMMLPSAAPVILQYSASRGSKQPGRAARGLLMTLIFGVGYLLVWGGFSLLAAAAQMLLSGASLLSPALAFVSPMAAATVLTLAGLYEWTPVKHSCLEHCRNPSGFLNKHWRPGPWGALRVGAAHGVYCLGCCCVLMLLLFVGGVMNLLWVAALAVLVLVQKHAPAGPTVTFVIGGLMMFVGLALAAQAIIVEV